MGAISAVTRRARLNVGGAVQGVGFRPFVYRLASRLELGGWVANDNAGVTIEVEGDAGRVDEFVRALRKQPPPLADVTKVSVQEAEPTGSHDFEIRASTAGGPPTAVLHPDEATCPKCVSEVLDPADRRYLYPFTNCTDCGPRYTIIEAVPFDRENTTMRAFEMCIACADEYADPSSRRFHAVANACPDCGPRLTLWDRAGEVVSDGQAALEEAAQRIKVGGIVALKGLGGFHLLVDAYNDEAVTALRKRKNREEKPFAVMCAAWPEVETLCAPSPGERRLLGSSAAPIVLLRRREDARSSLAASVAPANPYLGVMLPYTPLHHLVLAAVGRAVVATSGNVSDEPIVTDEKDALSRLGGIADLFLVHDRPIARPMDDSIVQEVGGQMMVLRRARGFAPMSLDTGGSGPAALALGGHLKSAVACMNGAGVFVGRHVGDLETDLARAEFRKSVSDTCEMRGTVPDVVVHDRHPDYYSTRYAQETGIPALPVQHHLAHVVGCAAENAVEGPFLGVAWDGAGYGDDATVWGGEFLSVDGADWQRAGYLRRFRLAGGEQAIREPRRAAAGVLHEMSGQAALADGTWAAGVFSENERDLIAAMLERGVNSPFTSSAGRLFDAVAAIVGLCARASFEGQAAMALEFAIAPGDGLPENARCAVRKEDGAWVADWQPTLSWVVDSSRRGLDPGVIARCFHDALAEAIVDVAGAVGQQQVVLSGGCFQNRYLSARALARLEEEGFTPFAHSRIPPGDGGLAFGQLCWLARLHAQAPRDQETR